jgi:hypothetical protein
MVRAGGADVQAILCDLDIPQRLDPADVHDLPVLIAGLHAIDDIDAAGDNAGRSMLGEQCHRLGRRFGNVQAERRDALARAVHRKAAGDAIVRVHNRRLQIHFREQPPARIARNFRATCTDLDRLSSGARRNALSLETGRKSSNVPVF